jgi:hypothetical protein
MIELTNSELFSWLTEITIRNRFFDLHNEFTCTLFSYNSQSKRLDIEFFSNDKDVKLFFFFEESEVKKININYAPEDASTVNNFYRGRFDLGDGLSEYFEDGSAYFYLEFENGDAFEIKAMKLFADYVQTS